MELLYPQCAAIDVHKRTAVAAVGWVDERGRRQREVRTFSTMTGDLERLRDWLVGFSTAVAGYVAELCRRRYGELEPQLCALYDLAQQLDRPAFQRAVEQALAQQAIGAEYVRALAAPGPVAHRPHPAALAPAGHAGPSQREVERELAHYERYVANRAAVAGAATGGA